MSGALAKACAFAMSEPASFTRTDIAMKTAGTPDADGFLWTSIGELEGSWTELAVDLDVPASWIPTDGGTVILRAFAMDEASDQLIGEWDLSALALRSVGAQRFARLRASGQCARGFRVELGATVRVIGASATATATLLGWGDQAGSPGVAGEDSSITPGAHVPRASLSYELDGVTGRWVPTRTSGGSTIVTGSATPVEAAPNRTDTVPVWAFNSVWDPGASRWNLLLGDVTGRAVVKGNGTVVDGVAVPVTDALRTECFIQLYSDVDNQWFNQRCDIEGIALASLNAQNIEGGASTLDAGEWCNMNNRGDLFVLLGLPDPSAPTPAQVASDGYRSVQAFVLTTAGVVTKAACLSVTANNDTAAALYFCVVDQRNVPVNGDVIKWAALVPAHSSVSKDFVRDLRLAIGVAGCWSSTPNVVTLAAIVGSAWVQYTT